jgi:hypothetical protein
VFRNKPSSYQEFRVTSLTARVVGVIRRPRSAFSSIAAAPDWAGVLVLTTFVTFASSAGFLSTNIGRQALVDQWERTATAFGQPIDDAKYAAMEARAADGALGLEYAAVTALVSGPVLAFGLSALLFVMLSRRQTPAGSAPRASYRQVLSIVCYAGVILALRQLIAAPVDYVRETIASPTSLVQFFTMLDEASPLARFLGVVDLLVVWWIVVLAIGMSVLYRQRTRRLALMFAGAYLAIALLAALAMAMSGGTA